MNQPTEDDSKPHWQEWRDIAARLATHRTKAVTVVIKWQERAAKILGEDVETVDMGDWQMANALNDFAQEIMEALYETKNQQIRPQGTDRNAPNTA